MDTRALTDLVVGLQEAAHRARDGEEDDEDRQKLREMDPDQARKWVIERMDGLGHFGIAAKFALDGRTGLGPSRVSGEFRRSEKFLYLTVNDKSGRYMSKKVRGEDLDPADAARWLDNVAKLFSEHLGVEVRAEQFKTAAPAAPVAPSAPVENTAPGAGGQGMERPPAEVVPPAEGTAERTAPQAARLDGAEVERILSGQGTLDRDPALAGPLGPAPNVGPSMPGLGDPQSVTLTGIGLRLVDVPTTDEGVMHALGTVGAAEVSVVGRGTPATPSELRAHLTNVLAADLSRAPEDPASVPTAGPSRGGPWLTDDQRRAIVAALTAPDGSERAEELTLAAAGIVLGLRIILVPPDGVPHRVRTAHRQAGRGGTASPEGVASPP